MSVLIKHSKSSVSLPMMITNEDTMHITMNRFNAMSSFSLATFFFFTSCLQKNTTTQFNQSSYQHTLTKMCQQKQCTWTIYLKESHIFILLTQHQTNSSCTFSLLTRFAQHILPHTCRYVAKQVHCSNLNIAFCFTLFVQVCATSSPFRFLCC